MVVAKNQDYAQLRL